MVWCNAAAQCAHAALGVVEEWKDRPEHAHAFEYWSANGHPKIAVQTTDLVSLWQAPQDQSALLLLATFAILRSDRKM